MKRKILSLILAVFTICSLGMMTVSAAGTASTYYEYAADGSFFYSFSKNGEWSDKLSIGNREFVQTDGINDSGFLKVQIAAGGGNNSNGVNKVIMPQNGKTVKRAKDRYPEYQNLVKGKTYVSFIFTGLKGAPLYNDAACTEPAGEATGGFVQVDVSADVNGASIFDGAWHDIVAEVPSKGALHSTRKYVDMSGISSHVWIRIYGGNTFTATTDYFTKAYLDACTADGTTPSVTCLIDDLEGYHVGKNDITKTSAPGGFAYIDDFSTRTYWAATGSGSANREYAETLMGRNGVAILKQTTSSFYTHTIATKVAEGEKLRVSANVALENPENFVLKNVNVNALIIMNGGSSNKVAGFYEDEACTTPCTSVNGNAITYQVTMLSGFDAGWNHFSYEFDTTQVIKSSIKRKSSDGAKTTVYIKPWEVAGVQLWYRVSNGTAGTSSLSKTAGVLFTKEYLDACTASGDTPTLRCAIDNLGVASVAADEVIPTDVSVATLTADKTDVKVGDTVNVNYTLASGKTETASRVFVKADNKVVASAKNVNGTWSFTVPAYALSKALSVDVIPAAGVYSITPYSLELGTVGEKVQFDAKATENGVTWSYDGTNDTENSVVIAALYNADKEMIAVRPVTITKGGTFNDTVEEDGAVYAKVFHWVDTKNAQPIEINFAFELR